MSLCRSSSDRHLSIFALLSADWQAITYISRCTERRYLARLAAAAKSTDYRTAAAASKTIAAKDTSAASAASTPAAAVGMIANTLSATSSVGPIKLVV